MTILAIPVMTPPHFISIIAINTTHMLPRGDIEMISVMHARRKLIQRVRGRALPPLSELGPDALLLCVSFPMFDLPPNHISRLRVKVVCFFILLT